MLRSRRCATGRAHCSSPPAMPSAGRGGDAEEGAPVASGAASDSVVGIVSSLMSFVRGR